MSGPALHPSIQRRLDELGFHDLYPPQEEAITKGITGQNLVVSIPTASGKTIIAEALLVHRLLTERENTGRRKKAIYLCPLRALASEKLEEFREHWEPLGLTVGISTGDFDRVERTLELCDIIILTNEKADSILRARVPWIQEVAVLVSDEIHLINDASRGVTLEIVLSRFRAVVPALQVIGLSATIGNSSEIAGWLNAQLVSSEWRPVNLKEGVYYKQDIQFSDGTTTEIPHIQDGNPLIDVVSDTILQDAQVLVFAPTRRSSKSTAKKLKLAVKRLLQPEETQQLVEIARKIGTKAEAKGSGEIRELVDCIKCGVSFHHAGLTMSQRHKIEKGFRAGLIKVISATPTLAAGINAPARRVIIQSLRRYDVNLGRSLFIPIIEYKQMAGRAGRPRYDPWGEAIILAKDFRSASRLAKRYIESEPEPIESKLGAYQVLRKHILGSVVAGYESSFDELLVFLSSTFFGFQHHLGAHSTRNDLDVALLPDRAQKTRGWNLVSRFEIDGAEEWKRAKARTRDPEPPETIEEKLKAALEFLENNGFISLDGNHFVPQKLGILTSKLYLEPESSLLLLEGLHILKQKANLNRVRVTPLTFFHMIARTPDCPKPIVSSSELDPILAQLKQRNKELCLPNPIKSVTAIREEELTNFKYGLVLERWIGEASESDLEQDHGVFPGDLHRYSDSARWLLYCLRRIMELRPIAKVKQYLEKLETRVTYGIKPELVELVSIKGIGRVRARLLFRAGFRTLIDFQQAEPESLNAIPGFGPSLIRQIYSQLSEKGGYKERVFENRSEISFTSEKTPETVLLGELTQESDAARRRTKNKPQRTLDEYTAG